MMVISLSTSPRMRDSYPTLSGRSMKTKPDISGLALGRLAFLDTMAKSSSTFTTDEGLVSNSVSAIHQDREGYIWFGTSGGASRYDGDKFINFTTDEGLASNFVSVIHQDREGYIWFGTAVGLLGMMAKSLSTSQSVGHRDLTLYRRSIKTEEGYIWFWNRRRWAQSIR